MIGNRTNADAGEQPVRGKQASPNRAVMLSRALLACALLANGAAFPQVAPPPSPDGATVAAPSPLAIDPSYKPGFLEELRRWFGNSKAKLDEGIRNTQDALEGIGTRATDAAKDSADAAQHALGGFGTRATEAAKDAAGAAQQATGAIVGLPGVRIVNGRERCAVAANGAPDCAAAAAALCRANGFGSGRGLDVNSTQKCPALAWWSKRQAEGECKTETFVLRAVCQ